MPHFEHSPSQEQVVVGGEDIRKDDTKGDSRRSDLDLNKNLTEAYAQDLHGHKRKATEHTEASEKAAKRRRIVADKRFDRMTTVDQIEYIKERSRLSDSKQRSGGTSSLLHKFNQEKFYDSQQFSILPHINASNIGGPHGEQVPSPSRKQFTDRSESINTTSYEANYG